MVAEVFVWVIDVTDVCSEWSVIMALPSISIASVWDQANDSSVMVLGSRFWFVTLSLRPSHDGEHQSAPQEWHDQFEARGQEDSLPKTTKSASLAAKAKSLVIPMGMAVACQRVTAVSRYMELTDAAGGVKLQHDLHPHR